MVYVFHQEGMDQMRQFGTFLRDRYVHDLEVSVESGFCDVLSDRNDSCFLQHSTRTMYMFDQLT